MTSTPRSRSQPLIIHDVSGALPEARKRNDEMSRPARSASFFSIIVSTVGGATE